MSTSPEILMIDSDPCDRGFAFTSKARNCGPPNYFTSHVDGEDLTATTAESNDASHGEEEPRQHASRDDHGAEQQPGGRPHIEIPPGTSLEDLERAAVEKALQVHRGNRTHAAKTLGISVRTLQRKLKAWQVPALNPRQQPPRRELSIACPG